MTTATAFTDSEDAHADPKPLTDYYPLSKLTESELKRFYIEQPDFRDSQIRADSPPPEQVRVLESESKPIFRESTSEVRLCVIKLPRTRGYDLRTAKHIKAIFENERDFLREVKPEHRHIVRYFEITDNFIFMEHCPSGCLEDYLKPDLKVPVLKWTIQLCTVLVYLHDMGWAHNQLYPCNILVSHDGSELKVCDFDAVTPAKIAGGGSGYPAAPELWITQKQTKADFVTDSEGHLCDVYSLGLITWFLQHGGKEIPDNHMWDEIEITGDYVPSHLELLDTDGLELADFMRSCWVHYKSRPTSTILLERLRSEL